MNHIKYKSDVRRENLMMYPPMLTHEQANELDNVANRHVAELRTHGLRESFAAKPCMQAYGPMRCVVVDPSRESGHHILGRGRNYRNLYAGCAG